jgi:acyl carrier protein
MVDSEKRSAGDVVKWLVAEISRLAGVPGEQIDVDAPITDYLFDSRDALSLTADLQGWLGVEMSASIVWDHPTIAALADHLAEQMRAAPGAAALPPG